MSVENAIPLVAVDDEGNFSVPPEAVDLLNEITGPIAVVSVAGPYRSGKSFLMNCLSQDDTSRKISTTKFQVGPTVNACTRGLWLFPSSVTLPTSGGGNMRVLFVDSEGLSAIKASEGHDVKIFSLAVLISSLFIFNSFGAVDEQNIKKLGFITQLSKNIHVKANTESVDPRRL
eukprot:SAG11_NODE_6776_length_1251_cov_1.041667_2_plen_174_part_00